MQTDAADADASIGLNTAADTSSIEAQQDDPDADAAPGADDDSMTPD